MNALDDSDDSDTFLGVISSPEINSIGTDPWKIPIAVNGTEVLFKVDTGADVSVIPESEVKKLKVTMNVTRKVLTGPCKSQLNVCGSFRAKLNTGSPNTTLITHEMRENK